MSKRLRGEEVLQRIFAMDDDDDDSDITDGENDDENDIPDAQLSTDNDDENSSEEDDDDDIDTDTDVQEWQKMRPDGPVFARFPFTVRNKGSQVTNAPQTVLGFFQLFFTDELLIEITKQTNDYAQLQLTNRQLLRHSIWKKWKTVSVDEMKAYLGMILNMALNDKPNVVDFFSKDWTTTMSFFVAVFSRVRFLQIQ